MVQTAETLMTVEAFLSWDDGTDRRYELIDGEPVMMAPAREWHGTILLALGWVFRENLKKPFRAQAEAGIRMPHRPNSYYVADLAITAAPVGPNREWMEDPVVIVEVLSPETQRRDRQRKRPDYAELPSVQEIALVSTDRRLVEPWRRGEDGSWPREPILCTETLSLTSVGVEAGLDDVYLGDGINTIVCISIEPLTTAFDPAGRLFSYNRPPTIVRAGFR